MEGLTTAKLAHEGGVNVETIRYYERHGLLPRPPRTHSGYRVFSDDAVTRLRFIKHAQALGFSLNEIKDLLTLLQRCSGKDKSEDCQRGRENPAPQSHQEGSRSDGCDLFRARPRQCVYDNPSLERGDFVTQRRGYGPVFFRAVGAAAVLIGEFYLELNPRIHSGLGILVIASVWNAWPGREKTALCSSCPPGTAHQIERVNQGRL
jgi:DNA-binding transcriptional MerR regulator